MRYVIRERFFRLGEDSDITDEQGRPVYHVDGKVLSLRNTLIVRDLAGAEVARVERQLIALRPTYHITRQGQEVAEVRKKLFSPFVDRFTIDIPGPHDLSVTGSLLEHEYTIARGGELVATVSKRWLSLTETYGLDIAPGEDDLLILASVLALDLAQDRERQEHRDNQA
ncbi:MAG TPA: LURP-one-related family protein [Herpetosiphonaceae bacterium]|nr:LURP-one-related family protein [Herpetosiphonaceae bacterium]